MSTLCPHDLPAAWCHRCRGEVCTHPGCDRPVYDTSRKVCWLHAWRDAWQTPERPRDDA
jgi:hypothetical protein